MKKLAKLISILLTGVLLFDSIPAFAYEQDDFSDTGFALIETVPNNDLSGTVYQFEHTKTGAEVIYVDNGAARYASLPSALKRRLPITRGLTMFWNMRSFAAARNIL